MKNVQNPGNKLELGLESKVELELKLERKAKLELDLQPKVKLELELEVKLAENYVWFTDVPLKPP